VDCRNTNSSFFVGRNLCDRITILRRVLALSIRGFHWLSCCQIHPLLRSMFVGFPINQVGWSIFVFYSTNLAYNDRLFHDAPPSRHPGSPQHALTVVLAHTDPPQVLPDNTDSNVPWAPYSSTALQSLDGIVDSSSPFGQLQTTP
jgi:hypothetical protein